jgi:hypothetical protein
MGYIDDKFKIRSTRAMEKHITKITAIEVMCIKMADVVRVIWAMGNKLNHFDIKASVIYVIKEEELQEAVDAVMVSFKSENKIDSFITQFKEELSDEDWSVTRFLDWLKLNNYHMIKIDKNGKSKK